MGKTVLWRNAMTFFEKKPMVMIVIGIFGISLSSIFVRYSQAPFRSWAAP